MAALCSIHAAGFIYGDLKPENILITEAGHVKLGDFGGCRAHSKAARDVLDCSMRALSELRDGDWKKRSSFEDEKGFEEKEGDLADALDDDDRVEGTAAYLPPEVVAGGFPKYSADVWSFGCVVFFCIAGKPPLIDVDNDETMKRVISFARSGEDFYGKLSDSFSEPCKKLISKCCEINANARPRCSDLAEDPWFGESVFMLHSKDAKELNVGNFKAGQVDSSWTRRQYSMIWSPQVSLFTNKFASRLPRHSNLS